MLWITLLESQHLGCKILVARYEYYVLLLLHNVNTVCVVAKEECWVQVATYVILLLIGEVVEECRNLLGIPSLHNALILANLTLEECNCKTQELVDNLLAGALKRWITEEASVNNRHNLLSLRILNIVAYLVLTLLNLGDNLFINSVVDVVADELLNLGLEVCHVNQGYTKCASLPLGEQAIITADPTVAKCAKERGIDVLQIQEGHISLPGYDHGFIGGCASFAPHADTSTVFFCGDVSTHPDAPKMKDFCKKHKFEVVNLFQNPLCDTGTIFMI